MGMTHIYKMQRKVLHNTALTPPFTKMVSIWKMPFPIIVFLMVRKGCMNPPPSGHIDPRRLIQAQLKIVAKNGGTIVTDVVTEATAKDGITHITTNQGHTFKAKKSVVSNGRIH